MATVFDDTYTGPRWRYGLQHRPISCYFSVGAFPDPILFSHRPSADPRRFPHGEADWPCEIPEEEARHHSLVLVEAPRLLDPAAYDRHLAAGGSEPDWED